MSNVRTDTGSQFPFPEAPLAGYAGPIYLDAAVEQRRREDAKAENNATLAISPKSETFTVQVNRKPPPSLPFASSFFASSRLCCSHRLADRLLLILPGSAQGLVNEVSVSQQLARRDRHFSCTQATTPSVPTLPKHQPRLGQIYGLVDDVVRLLAKELVQERLLPPAAVSDALHAAVASLHNVDYLLTWNCRHLANPHLQKGLRTFMAGHRLVLPEICTPIDLAGD